VLCVALEVVNILIYRQKCWYFVNGPSVVCNENELMATVLFMLYKKFFVSCCLRN